MLKMQERKFLRKTIQPVAVGTPYTESLSSYLTTINSWVSVNY